MSAVQEREASRTPTPRFDGRKDPHVRPCNYGYAEQSDCSHGGWWSSHAFLVWGADERVVEGGSKSSEIILQ